MAIDIESLKSERDQLKVQLRQIEIDQRKLETELKSLRQKEIRGKREVEALSTLIEIHEPRPVTATATETATETAEPAAG